MIKFGDGGWFSRNLWKIISRNYNYIILMENMKISFITYKKRRMSSTVKDIEGISI